ncbi:response regulator [Frigoriglobus tundricola]|uniref:Chemotaxis regulator-transmits chemoreceptor signals to flagellar motor components CheY n=1 Tax=Frigoriglobus tundricola TaxID=2774151 RepID=A0A6M5YV95_9BACT|nr:response regulator [Frigoriglobus tundricola]QJW98007.1 Chemotaxis regulator - transmits chemoreceptor signals to flagellar motor components CheY [Frigoriglobus tundricola]
MAKTILVVDDSPTMRQMVSDTLRQAGFDVVLGVNGADALGRLGGQRIHLVITDFNMPVMGGLVLIERLRARPEFRFTPILVLTTESEEKRKQEGRTAGATGWVVKPFDPTRLVQVVNRLLP